MRAFAVTLAFLAFAATSFAQTLQTAAPVLSQFEDGSGLGDSQKMVAGETVFFRFAVAGFKTGTEGRIEVTGHAQIFDSRGIAISPVDEVVVATSLRDEDKEYRPRLHFQFALPPISPPGTWRVKFDVVDLQSKQKAEGETTFVVEGRNVAPASALTVRNLGFYRGQDDESALKIAAYRGGDMVWVRFDVTGYKYGEQNSIDVAYDVAVKSSEGKPLFSQENAAVEKSQAFYPQPWIPGTFSLTLQPTMRPGLYSVTITARDDSGKQTASAEGQFKVE